MICVDFCLVLVSGDGESFAFYIFCPCFVMRRFHEWWRDFGIPFSCVVCGSRNCSPWFYPFCFGVQIPNSACHTARCLENENRTVPHCIASSKNRMLFTGWRPRKNKQAYCSCHRFESVTEGTPKKSSTCSALLWPTGLPYWPIIIEWTWKHGQWKD